MLWCHKGSRTSKYFKEKNSLSGSHSLKLKRIPAVLLKTNILEGELAVRNGSQVDFLFALI